jgi:DNA-directed RNA polymerase I, II, and III subunit RPABC2
VKRDENDLVIDEYHKTIPILTKYERARILGLRITQLNKGAKPYINVTKNKIIDNHIIAEQELNEKRLPFIIMRPIPNGGKEYWRLEDLEVVVN